MVRFVVAVLVVMAGPALADDVSPWFGSEGQQPFQLVASQASLGSTTVPETWAGLHLAQACTIEGCLTDEGSAKVLEANPVSP
jgi:hypothetical protein